MPTEQQGVRDIDPAWVPPRPSLAASRRPMRDNNSGEDFLYMHRQMIARVNAILAEVNDPGYQRVEGWKSVPPPGDADYPIPDFPGSGLEAIKSADYYERFLAPWERQYTDPNYLRSVTLGQLGSDIEYTIHNDLHMRWASPSAIGYRPNTLLAQGIDEKWDNPAYNYLGDTYSSHVNPLFWKLHGWVDDRVEDWKKAHAIDGEIQWQGTWVGPADHHVHPHDGVMASSREATAGNAPDKLQRIDRIISASSASDFDGFFRPSQQRLR